MRPQLPPELRSSFLEAKVRWPARGPALVRRDRLIDALAAGETSTLTTVSGPAGSGKTSLLLDWAATGRRTGPVAWLSLDVHDNDPAQFRTGLLAALAAVGVASGPDLAELLALARGHDRTFLDRLGLTLTDAETPTDGGGDAYRDAAARPGLVLDDYHVITEGPIHDTVELMVRYLATHLRLVIATRTTPPLPLARLRAGGTLTEIRFDDLRFTVDEGARLLTALGRAGDDDEAHQLVARTEGWAAALYVSTLDGGGGARGHLADYLVDEVLAGEPEERRRFLLETSVLDPLTPARCDAVTGRDDSARILRELQRSTQFIRADEQDRWYRCHALLRDLLRDELEVRGIDAGDLHRRASAAASAEGDVLAAVRHALDGHDLDSAGHLIGRHWIDFTNRGRFATVMGWIDAWLAADGETRAPDPTVFVVGAWMALHTGRLDDVEHWLGRAETVPHDGPLPDGCRSVASAAAIVRTSHRRRIGAVAQGLAASEVAAEEEADPTSPWRAVALVGRGATLFWAGRFDQAASVLTESTTIARATGLRVPVLLGEGHLALIDRHQGRGPAAARRAEAATALARTEPVGAYDQAAAAHLALGLCRLDRVDLDGARTELDEAGRLARQGGERLLVAAAQLGLAEAAGLAGRPTDAADHLDRAEQILAGCSAPGILADLTVETARRLSARRPGGPRGGELTDRERTVLRYLAGDLTIPEIARELSVSANTVKSQVAAIRTKLGVSSRSEAVRVARDQRLLP